MTLQLRDWIWALVAIAILSAFAVACVKGSEPPANPAPEPPPQKRLLQRIAERIAHPFRRDTDSDSAGERKPDRKPRERFPWLRELLRVLWWYFTAPMTLVEGTRQIIVLLFVSFLTWLLGNLGFRFTKLLYGRPKHKSKGDDGEG